jgi:exopolysaccharide biosynthesis predicted pyruvyltransferase EpsI
MIVALDSANIDCRTICIGAQLRDVNLDMEGQRPDLRKSTKHKQIVLGYIVKLAQWTMVCRPLTYVVCSCFIEGRSTPTTIYEIRMIRQDPILPALAAINAETLRAFDWLTASLDRRLPVTFVPNPGNIGDAAINIACLDYLTEQFDKVEICAMGDTPHTECVFVGGGGNAVEPLYVDVREFLDRLPLEHRLFIFPTTIKGYSRSLRRVASITRILCRELISMAYVAKQIGRKNVALAHDAAFLLAPRLRKDFAGSIGEVKTAECRSFRTDSESINWKLRGNDFMAEHSDDAWTDLAGAREHVWAVASYLLGFGQVETDRLHCAILAAILGRRTILRANSYYKNAAVFDHSLSRLSNTTFLPPPIDRRAKDMLRGLSRRFRWSRIFTSESQGHD